MPFSGKGEGRSLIFQPWDFDMLEAASGEHHIFEVNDCLVETCVLQESFDSCMKE